MINTTVTWPYILLYRWDGTTYEPPRILARHGSTFNGQRSHPHPRITPDGKHVLYTSDVSDYSNLYLAPIGDIDDLPVLDTTSIV
jgi:oligogalacturonide lyase